MKNTSDDATHVQSGSPAFPDMVISESVPF